MNSALHGDSLEPALGKHPPWPACHLPCLCWFLLGGLGEGGGRFPRQCHLLVRAAYF